MADVRASVTRRGVSVAAAAFLTIGVLAIARASAPPPRLPHGTSLLTLPMPGSMRIPTAPALRCPSANHFRKGQLAPRESKWSSPGLLLLNPLRAP